MLQFKWEGMLPLHIVVTMYVASTYSHWHIYSKYMAWIQSEWL